MIEEIQRLKKEKNAVILAHFYQPGEIQLIADFVGDSLELAKYAVASPADTIVFCGVDFMAESAKILCPEKTVLLPSQTATCPMANSISAEDIRSLRKKHPEAAVVTYINSSAEVKAESDICCTSSNAIAVVNSLEEREIIFVPDKNLGNYVSHFTDKKIILFEGCCPIHDRITADNVVAAKKAHPLALLAVHPECGEEIIQAADFCGSTSQIIRYASASCEKEFIIGTEEGVLNVLRKNNPDKIFYSLAENFVCKNMKKITLHDVYISLKDRIYAVSVDENTAKAAWSSIERMMEISK
jgi:quinolinate synthase